MNLCEWEMGTATREKEPNERRHFAAVVEVHNVVSQGSPFDVSEAVALAKRLEARRRDSWEDEVGESQHEWQRRYK